MDAGVAGGGGELAEAGQARRRRGRRGVGAGLAQRPDSLAQSGQRVPAGGFDGGQGVPRLGGLGVDDPGTGPGLDRDDADVVGDLVVQVAGELQPVGGDCLRRGLGVQGFGVGVCLADWSGRPARR